MLNVVGNPKYRFSRVAAHLLQKIQMTGNERDYLCLLTKDVMTDKDSNQITEIYIEPMIIDY